MGVVCIDSLVNSTVKAVKRVEQTHKGENVFCLGTGRGYSVLNMVKAFERVNGVKIPYEIVFRRPGYLATVYASPDKSAQLLGWRAQYDLDDMCRDA